MAELHLRLERLAGKIPHSDLTTIQAGLSLLMAHTVHLDLL
jgi:hypothetical protein